MSNKVMMLLMGVLMIFMLGLGGGLFMMWNKLSALNVQSNANAGDQPNQGKAIDPPLGPIFELATFIVNLADKGGNRYLRVTMDLELQNPELETEVNKRLPQVRDSILMILPSKRFEDISSVEGKIALRDEILAKINGIFTKGKVTNIYFKEFVIQ
jgi:flagellar FliL protein